MGTPVSVTKLSELMNLTPRRVQQLTKEGLPKGRRGEYVLEDCLRWYIGSLQSKVASGQTDGYGERSGRERLDLAKAEREELSLAKDRQETLTVTDFERAMADMITPARHELLALEAGLRPKIGPEHAALVGAEIKRSLRTLGTEGPL